MKKVFIALAILFAAHTLSAQVQVYPTNWWAGMKMNKIQLMLYSEAGDDIKTVSLAYPGITVTKIHSPENKRYSFVDVTIAPEAKPGTAKILINNKTTVNFPLYARRAGNGKTFAQGINSSDFVYLIMPDRFSNGNPLNDVLPGMLDQSLNRDSIYHRHGGDLQGIINHLDYIESLGVTALWLTPVLENNMLSRTEHGYAITNHYVVEPRLGGAAAYKKLSAELHKRGMKLIQDAVYNHVGDMHFTVTDPPMNNWLHHWDEFTKTSYREQVLFDPHAAQSQKNILSDGWFTQNMPDLNQSNAYVANYLIQHAIWCVEEFGVDGWRIDTYVYNDLDFMNRCNKALLTEYPSLTLFGETWVHGVLNQAYFVRNKLTVPFQSNLHGVTDFQTLFYGIQPALTQPFGWTEGVSQLYNTLSKDFVYEDAANNVVFLDNHDLSRFFSVIGENPLKQKMALGWLLTTRGIPQMYYGTEVLMRGLSNPDGNVRRGFPGGWKGDIKDAFSRQNLESFETDNLDFVQQLGQYRKRSAVLQKGKLTQYIPENGVYVYFRHIGDNTIMCVMNTTDGAQMVDTRLYAEMLKGRKNGKNVIDGRNHILPEPLELQPWEMLIIEVQ